MAGITKCMNEECPIKKNCRRHTAVTNTVWQSYSYFNHNNDTECDEFWDNSEMDQNVKPKADDRKKTD